MRILLDTNIIIHRESAQVLNKDIGVLFRWIDNLHYTKCIHPITVREINKLRASSLRNTFNVKLNSYNTLKVEAPISLEVDVVSRSFDVNENDRNDTLLLNELYNKRVHFLITQNRKIEKNLLNWALKIEFLQLMPFLKRLIQKTLD